MRLARVELERSPRGPGLTRLAGEIVYAGTGRPREWIWFDVADAVAGDLNETGNPWLALLLPLAVTLREPLSLCRPVDPALREGAEALMEVWRGWYPGVAEAIPVEAEVLPPGTPDEAARTGSFFSGGIDSFYTLLRHQPGGEAILKFRIDDLITIHGFDVPLAHCEAFERVARRVATIAAEVCKASITIATNIRESGWSVTNWGRLGQGPALAAVALVLERRYRRVLIPSSMAYYSFRPWGTHPLVDSLHSTTRTEIRNDGALHRRMGKINVVGRSEFAMRELRVCWAGADDSNCGRCEKCIRTLTQYELLGLRDRCVTFPPNAWSLEALAGLRLRQDLDRAQVVRLRDHARRLGREDVAAAAVRCLRRYDLRVRAGRIARAIGLRRRAAP
jgi:hypothetical protein